MTKPIVQNKSFVKSAYTIESVISGEHKAVFAIETEQAFYQGNTLTEVMLLWQISKDKTEVINISRIG